jgi:hypothetical protein
MLAGCKFMVESPMVDRSNGKARRMFWVEFGVWIIQSPLGNESTLRNLTVERLERAKEIFGPFNVTHYKYTYMFLRKSSSY